MKIGVLTSSRADFGIYLPLLKQLKEDTSIILKIIAFGTHSSFHHGQTIQEIKENGFHNIDTISSLLTNDDEQSIATSYGLTTIKFADYWSSHMFDLVFCLGDRFEMSAAVQAGVPFGITFAHIHGGETTLGAIDNVYRHQITIASELHFTSTQEYAKKVKELIGTNEKIYNVGSLSLDEISKIELVNQEKLRDQFNIPQDDYILATFHPETVGSHQNEKYAKEMASALQSLAEQFIIVITMPNADTAGSLYRREIQKLKESLFPEDIVIVENFGKKNYFSAIRYATLLIGNSSSGIIEAASFGKYAVNVGDRQKGRAQNDNVLNCKFDKGEILETVFKANELGRYQGENIYFKENVADNIVRIIKSYNETL
ncbi:GDP/UDP-N,N'-diacetylbacillosamine 2-epimerase (hydrolysing) [Fodinibius roseus]|uniref:GDP/UDP-N,N'-diacetylbacillosamine 2-epimerase (Hydrolysing) n=1 Tax=Fodinibius roseus TaxID=1194090 RepID=A0A1M5J311_9BACT|nr:UDP-N-acetylglucosamine 2-epimerase [Fodinibius roseus]SHG34689.1 GDP/UDP-N,N'-diacetylbacillosamine 2-epimerase (hydrolysing) [Fodinibius roseus]